MRSAIGLPELREVFLTHFHADHYLGLPGMLKTFSLRGRTEPLAIYGPRGPYTVIGTSRPRSPKVFNMPGRPRT